MSRVIFGIVVVPVIGLVGAAIDYNHANAARTTMRYAIDSTGQRGAADGRTDQSVGLAWGWQSPVDDRPDPGTG
ncbi:Tad domain-containing protein [Bradyrhizobium sp.]|uniref:TadE/TadG family type IV pilus assembly protein n=1 Tax=Bradyrhizobium sp. TaxID=376 RepID=UPI002607ABB8|nr:Tad domain-containing protein [Bradyrhizobium sp.]